MQGSAQYRIVVFGIGQLGHALEVGPLITVIVASARLGALFRCNETLMRVCSGGAQWRRLTVGKGRC